MLTGAKLVKMSLIFVLLLCLSVPVFASSETFFSDRTWALGGEVEIRFKILSDEKIPDDLSPLDWYGVSRAPWEDNLMYASMEAYHAVTPDDVEIINYDEAKSELTLLFHKPGRYFVQDTFIYIFDPQNETLAAIGAELNDAVKKCRGKNEKETASSLRKWIVRRIQYGNDSSDYPERGQYEDPIGVLLGGKAICVGYSYLYEMMARQCGIKAFSYGLEIRKTGAGHVINLNRLDGVWSFTDVTWEDNGKSSRNKYFAMSEKQLLKYCNITDDCSQFYPFWFSSPEKTAELDRRLEF